MALGPNITGPLFEGLFDSDVGSRGVWELGLRNAFGPLGSYSSQGRQVAPMYQNVFNQYLAEILSRSPDVQNVLGSGLSQQQTEPANFLNYVGGLDFQNLYQNVPMVQRTGGAGGRYQPISRRVR